VVELRLKLLNHHDAPVSFTLVFPFEIASRLLRVLLILHFCAFVISNEGGSYEEVFPHFELLNPSHSHLLASCSSLSRPEPLT
jgi:hypothetical protein